MLNFLLALWRLIKSREFLTQLVAGAILGFFGFYWGPMYLDYRNRPQMSLDLKYTDGNRLVRSKALNLPHAQSRPECWGTDFSLFINNTGRQTVKDFYYSIIFPPSVEVNVPAANPVLQMQYPNLNPKEVTVGQNKDPNTKETILQGFISMPMYPGQLSAYPYNIYVTTCQTGRQQIRYYFRTSQGLVPYALKNVDVSENHRMGLLELIVPDSNGHN